MRHTLITLSGHLGSGKSTIAKMLAERLKWQYYSTGMAQRSIAKKRGISTTELNRLTITDKSIDEAIDAVFKNPPWGKNPCVVDSRLAWYFLPQSLKVYLTVDIDVAAERVFNAQNRISERYATVVEAKAYLQKRFQLELNHFMKNYHLDVTNLTQFDLVIDTTNLTPDQVCNKILSVL